VTCHYSRVSVEVRQDQWQTVIAMAVVFETTIARLSTPAQAFFEAFECFRVARKHPVAARSKKLQLWVVLGVLVKVVLALQAYCIAKWSTLSVERRSYRKSVSCSSEAIMKKTHKGNTTSTQN